MAITYEEVAQTTINLIRELEAARTRIAELEAALKKLQAGPNGNS